MKIGLLTAIWGRPRLTELVLRYYEQFDICRQLVGSVEDHLENHDFSIAKWENVFYPNSPLSDKWQCGLNAVNRDVDAVIIVGSDDLITPGYIEACKYLLKRGAEYIYMDGAYFYNAETGKMIWGNAERLGLGRCISRSLLDRMNWKLWPDGLENGLDGAMWERVQQTTEPKIVQLKDCKKEGLVGMDIKTGSNLWSFDHIKENLIHHEVDAGKVLRKYFPGVADELLNWNKLKEERSI